MFNGALVVVDQGDVVYEAAVGQADGSGDVPLTLDHRFAIGSVSKEFSAVGLMVLVERGRLSLDDAVSDHLPTLPDWAGLVRVRHLLTYTSGLPFPEVRDGTTEDALFADLHSVRELEFEPGTDHLYSNHNVLLRHRLIEALSGVPYATFVADDLFSPCGMDHTVFDPDRTAPSAAAAFDNRGTEDDFGRPTTTPFLTAHDLSDWGACVHDGTLLSPASVLLLADAFEGRQAGLGHVEVVDGAVESHWHDGSSYNYEAALYVRPAGGHRVALVSNNKNFRLAEVASAVEAILTGEPYEVPKRSVYMDLRTEVYYEGADVGLAFFHDDVLRRPDLYDLSSEASDLRRTAGFLRSRGRQDDALSVLTLAAERHPGAAAVHADLSRALLDAGDDATARVHARRALELDPANAVARATLDLLSD